MASIRWRASKAKEGRKKGRWVMRWKDEHGEWVTETTTLNKSEAQTEADRREAQAARVRSGEISMDEKSYRENAAKPLADHIADYKQSLVHRRVSLDHQARAPQNVERICKLGGITAIRELLPNRVQSAVAQIRAEHAPSTANAALTAIKAFCLWLETDGRIERTPLNGKKVPPYSTKVDRVKIRRSLTVEELGRLLKAAYAGPPIISESLGRGLKPTRWISGPDRYFLYRAATETGLRAKELRVLTPESFRLDLPQPTVFVAAESTKNKNEAVQPIRPAFANALREWLIGKPSGESVFIFPKEQANMLKKDLKAAGIPFRTKDGDLDFHALRVTYGTLLIRAGVNIKVVQVLMRHSSPLLTLALYAKADDSDKTAAVATLPDFNLENGRITHAP